VAGVVTMPDRPYDELLPSPIAAVLAMRSQAGDSVVAVGEMSRRQRDLYVSTRVDEELLRRATAEPRPHIICITGSAGGGKSGLIEKIRAREDLFSQIIEDATHADSPSVDQAMSLAGRLAQLADGAQGRPERPVLLAANTGMLVSLFDELARRAEAGVGPAFTGLESALLSRLGIDPSGNATGLRAVVVNLDDRATSGPGALLRDFLAAYDPARPSGVLGGAARCDTCAVREWCPVLANAFLVSGPAREQVDLLAVSAAKTQGRYDTPRALWDFTSQLVAPLDYVSEELSDPCGAVVSATRRGDRAWVMRRLLPASLFSASGSLGQRVADLDPARRPSAEAYDLLASAGLDPAQDGKLIRALSADVGHGGALQRAAELAELGEDDPASFPGAAMPAGWRGFLGRFLVACSYLGAPGSWPLARSGPFELLLAGYQALLAGEQAPSEAEDVLNDLVMKLERGLADVTGTMVNEKAYLPVKTYDPRDPSRVYVRFELETDTESFRLTRAMPVRNNPEGCEVVGYRPLAVTVSLAGVEVSVDAPTYRLLDEAGLGTLPATADAERFYALRRAAEALALLNSSGLGSQLLVEEPDSGRRYNVRRVAALAGDGRRLQVRPA